MHRIFNLELLVLRCDNITEQARRLQNRYTITQGINNKNILDLRKHHSLIIYYTTCYTFTYVPSLLFFKTDFLIYIYI